MEIKSISDGAFKNYGRIHNEYDVSELVERMETFTPLTEEVVYVPSDKNLENIDIMQTFSDSFFGGLPIQIGYCNGHNKVLNALEYHRSSEINVAATDMILLIGLQTDMNEDYTYDSSKVEGFFVPKGTVVEMFATTLHYAPCGVKGNGFKCTVVLPKDTNLDLDVVPTFTQEDKLLVAKNKWLIENIVEVEINE